MAAGTYNLTGSNAIERGACYSYSVDLNTSTGEYSLSGYGVSGYLRRKWDRDEGLFGGSIRQFNQRWVLCPEFDGNLRFYRSEGTTWVEYRALFMDGVMIKIREVFDEPLTQWYREGLKDKGLE